MTMSAGATCDVISAQVTTADIVSDQIAVTLSAPAGASGQLAIELPGVDRNGVSFIYPDISQTASAGSYIFSFNRNSMPTGQYSQVNAKWTVGGTTATGSRGVSFNLLGAYRHSQYNTPNESSCTQGPGAALKSSGPPSCTFTDITLKNDFISQAWLNGSGITISFGPEQNEAICSYPLGVTSNVFRAVTSIKPSCQTYVDNTTLARDPNDARLQCGDSILIVGVGIKTITDLCPRCTGSLQMDNYTTQSACAPGSFGDLSANALITIRLR